MTPAIVAALCVMGEDILIADFEGKDYSKWVTTGTAFGPGPAIGTLKGQMPVSGYVGQGLVNTYFGGDESIGTLTSPEFTIERKYMSFRIGGGNDLSRLRLELLIGDTTKRVATGINLFPGGTEALVSDGWDVLELRGKTARIRIIDDSRGGWGHINVDHLVQTDTKPIMQLTGISRAIKVEHKYIQIPIHEDEPARILTVQIQGEQSVNNQVHLATGKPQYWASLDVSNLKGKVIRFAVDRVSSNSAAMDQIYQSDEIPGPGKLYDEPNRGQLRFSPRRGWTNDPNGMVFFKGEYHLFFQHNPYRAEWGNMHWGHAVSRDMVHWTELPIALFPDQHGTMWSGSAVVDLNNSSGLGPGMLLFSTADGDFTQIMTHSSDGRTFHKFKHNPVVPNIAHANRDPKVFWYAPDKKWVMLVYLEIPGHPTMQFLSSYDLVHWTPTSRIEGFHECPDFFELPVSGQAGVKKWVLTAANSNYQIGTFDGETFHPDGPILQGHRGKGFYAAQTFSDLPKRRVQIGWFQPDRKGMPFNQAMSLPMELKLVSDPDRIKMTWTPVRELQSLRVKKYALDSLSSFHAELAEFEFAFVPDSGAIVRMNFRGLEVIYEQASSSLRIGDVTAPAQLVDGKLLLHVFVDRNGVDLFASGGRTFMPWPFTPDPKNRGIGMSVSGGSIRVERMTGYELKSAWK